MKATGEKVAVVTGGNKGIGFEIVKSLCHKFTGTVYMTARNEEFGQKAAQQLEKLHLKAKFHRLDIDSLESIRNFKDKIRESHGGIDVLVNNAAIAYFVDSSTTPMDIQADNVIRINYFGTLNVCKELFSLMRPHGRVVNVSSALGHLSKINGAEPAGELLRKQLSSADLSEEKLSDLMRQFVQCCQKNTHRSNGWPNSAYVVSKVGVSALTRIQQRAFDKDQPDDDIYVNSVHPGWVKSDMTGWNGVYSVGEGAIAPTWAALLPPNTTDGPKGGYVWRDTQIVDWVNGPLPPGY